MISQSSNSRSEAGENSFFSATVLLVKQVKTVFQHNGVISEAGENSCSAQRCY